MDIITRAVSPRGICGEPGSRADPESDESSSETLLPSTEARSKGDRYAHGNGDHHPGQEVAGSLRGQEAVAKMISGTIRVPLSS